MDIKEMLKADVYDLQSRGFGVLFKQHEDMENFLLLMREYFGILGAYTYPIYTMTTCRLNTNIDWMAHTSFSKASTKTRITQTDGKQITSDIKGHFVIEVGNSLASSDLLSKLFVLMHEIGHHYKGHFLDFVFKERERLSKTYNVSLENTHEIFNKVLDCFINEEIIGKGFPENEASRGLYFFDGLFSEYGLLLEDGSKISYSNMEKYSWVEIVDAIMKNLKINSDSETPEIKVPRNDGDTTINWDDYKNPDGTWNGKYPPGYNKGGNKTKGNVNITGGGGKGHTKFIGTPPSDMPLPEDNEHEGNITDKRDESERTSEGNSLPGAKTNIKGKYNKNSTKSATDLIGKFVKTPNGDTGVVVGINTDGTCKVQKVVSESTEKYMNILFEGYKKTGNILGDFVAGDLIVVDDSESGSNSEEPTDFEKFKKDTMDNLRNAFEYVKKKTNGSFKDGDEELIKNGKKYVKMANEYSKLAKEGKLNEFGEDFNKKVSTATNKIEDAVKGFNDSVESGNISDENSEKKVLDKENMQNKNNDYTTKGELDGLTKKNIRQREQSIRDYVKSGTGGKAELSPTVIDDLYPITTTKVYYNGFFEITFRGIGRSCKQAVDTYHKVSRRLGVSLDLKKRFGRVLLFPGRKTEFKSSKRIVLMFDTSGSISRDQMQGAFQTAYNIFVTSMPKEERPALDLALWHHQLYSVFMNCQLVSGADFNSKAKEMATNFERGGTDFPKSFAMLNEVYNEISKKAEDEIIRISAKEQSNKSGIEPTSDLHIFKSKDLVGVKVFTPSNMNSELIFKYSIIDKEIDKMHFVVITDLDGVHQLNGASSLVNQYKKSKIHVIYLPWSYINPKDYDMMDEYEKSKKNTEKEVYSMLSGLDNIETVSCAGAIELTR